jgi:membrane-associated phospholipid phosphatase
MFDRVKMPLAACAACVAGVALLAVLVYRFGPVERLDGKFFIHLAADPYTRAHEVADAIARMADPAPLLVMLVGVCLLALSWGGRRQAVAAVVVVAGANVTTQLLKGLLAHPRYQPYAGLAQPWSDAFPSGHATAGASIGIALALAAPPRLKRPAVVLGGGFALAVGVCVAVLQWHFVSDVVGAYLVAAAWGFAALAALRLTDPSREARHSRPSARLAVSHE